MAPRSGRAKPKSRAKGLGARKGRAAKPRPRVVFEKSAGAVVFHRGDELDYLLIFSTYWEFPKGLVEAGESETEAAVREVREETGLEVRLVSGFRHEINYWYRREVSLVKKQVVYLLGEAPNREVTLSHEHREAKWLPFAAARAELVYENARAILDEADDYLRRRPAEGNGSGHR